jgi:uncharacterized protein (DUF1330 family)
VTSDDVDVSALAINVAVPEHLRWTDTRRGQEFLLTTLNVRLLPDGGVATKAYGRPVEGGRAGYVPFSVPDRPELAELVGRAASRAAQRWAAHRRPATAVGQPADGVAEPEAALTLCVLLWSFPGHEDALSAYEDAVLALLPEHGARLVSRVRRTGAGDGPVEVQIIELPSRAALDAYMADPRRTALTAERDAAIERTEILEVTARR